MLGALKLRNFVYFIEKHSPEMLFVMGTGGLIASTIFAVKATPKAISMIEEKKNVTNEQGIIIEEELTKKEIVKTTWKCYIPTAATIGLSLACLICSQSINRKRTMALATAYSLSESALKTYQDKVVETVGEKKERKIRDEIAQDDIRKNPVTKSNLIVTGEGDTLIYDYLSGRYFTYNLEKLYKIEAKLNELLYNEMFIPLNYYYDLLGIDRLGEALGDELGWDINNGPIEFEKSSALTAEDRPCMVIKFNIEPRYDYSSPH